MRNSESLREDKWLGQGHLYSVIQQGITKHLLYATHCANRCWSRHLNPGLSELRLWSQAVWPFQCPSSLCSVALSRLLIICFSQSPLVNPSHLVLHTQLLPCGWSKAPEIWCLSGNGRKSAMDNIWNSGPWPRSFSHAPLTPPYCNWNFHSILRWVEK